MRPFKFSHDRDGILEDLLREEGFGVVTQTEDDEVALYVHKDGRILLSMGGIENGILAETNDAAEAISTALAATKLFGGK